MILDPQLYVLLLMAALLLTLAPGPDTMFVLGAGVSALIAASPLAFDLLRLAGAAYLVWVGVPLLVRAWREPADVLTPAPPISARVYWQGLTTNLLNPKVAIFYVAFLPQFVTRRCSSCCSA